jgi:FkbM family methyltransferase
MSGSERREIVRVHGLAVEVDPARDPFGVIRGMLKGWYEATEVRLARALLTPEDRVVELGAGLGVVSSTLASIVGADAVLSFEANPAVADRARANAVRNGFSVTVEQAVCRPRAVLAEASGPAVFRLSQAFWASGLEDGSQAPDRSPTTGHIEVPARPLEDVLAAHRANVLVMDIEGGEIEILERADLTGLRALTFETHEAHVGRTRTNAAIQAACARGFEIDFSLTADGVVVLRRIGEG